MTLVLPVGLIKNRTVSEGGGGGGGGGSGVTEGWTGEYTTRDIVHTTTTASPVNVYWRRYIMQFTVTQAELQALSNIGSATSATFEGIRLFVQTQPAQDRMPLPSYAIGMKNLAASSTATTDPGDTGYTIVKSASNESFVNGTKTFNFTTNFSWTGGALGIAFAWGQCPVSYSASGQMYVDTGGYVFYARTDGAGTYVINSDATGLSTSARPVLDFYVSP